MDVTEGVEEALYGWAKADILCENASRGQFRERRLIPMGQKKTTIEASFPRSGEAVNAAGSNGTVGKALEELRQEIAGGLLYTHSRANSNTSRLLEAASFLYALIELLAEKEIITIEELDARKDTVAQRVEKRFLDKGMGVNLQAPERDKYTLQAEVQIDCENRVHLCQAACCRLWFPLSKQDVSEGAIQWDLRFPYIINQDAKGYCKHLERAACRCTVYQHRPLPCRTFDCQKGQRIWLDFENKVINPDLEGMFPETCPDEA